MGVKACTDQPKTSGEKKLNFIKIIWCITNLNDIYVFLPHSNIGTVLSLPQGSSKVVGETCSGLFQRLACYYFKNYIPLDLTSYTVKNSLLIRRQGFQCPCLFVR